MKIKTLTVKYEVARTKDYQSCRCGAEVTAELEEGDTVESVYKNLYREVEDLSNKGAERGIKTLTATPARPAANGHANGSYANGRG